MPIDDGLHPHEARPPMIRLIEMAQKLAMGIGASRADEDGLHLGILVEICREGGLHRKRVPVQV